MLKEVKKKLEKEYHLIDGYIDNFIYDNNTKTLVLIIRNPGWGFPYVHLLFSNVLYLSTQEFEFHYPDEKIYFVEVTSANDRIEELCASIQGNRFEERLEEIKNQELIQIKIYMVSGNEYEIICQHVNVSSK